MSTSLKSLIRPTMSVLASNTSIPRHLSLSCTVTAKKKVLIPAAAAKQTKYKEKLEIIAEYKCPECPFTHHDKVAMKKHLKQSHNALPYNCPECSEGFTNFAKLNHHIREIHINMEILKEPFVKVKTTKSEDVILKKTNKEKVVKKKSEKVKNEVKTKSEEDIIVKKTNKEKVVVVKKKSEKVRSDVQMYQKKYFLTALYPLKSDNAVLAARLKLQHSGTAAAQLPNYATFLPENDVMEKTDAPFILKVDSKYLCEPLKIEKIIDEESMKKAQSPFLVKMQKEKESPPKSFEITPKNDPQQDNLAQVKNTVQPQLTKLTEIQPQEVLLKLKSTFSDWYKSLIYNQK
jgi:hypothetical protein